MIKIVSGTFGYRDGDRVIPKTSADDPFSLTDKREKELVDDGVAIYVREELALEKVSDKDNDRLHDERQDPMGDELPTYNAEMKMDELKGIALVYGVDASKARSRAEIVTMIDEARAEVPIDDDDKPPMLEAEPPVIE